MAAPIDFYFDFSSPYGYFASTRIDALAAKHGGEVVWRPILLGMAFKVTGGQPLPTLPLKGDYGKHDMARCARYYRIPFRIPTQFPVATQAPGRAFYWAADQDPRKAKALAAALFRAYLVEDRDISNPEITAEVAAAAGYDRQAVLAALKSPEVKERLVKETQAALDRGVFGSPFVVVDQEPFWGMDRLEQVDKWLATGGW
ncbi:MAG: 2-hydroxychromene-2-carboxylate isomerase [Betaproteobacteria bacterium]|nr:2-hydroxychromene-2-carboxylate isomerase [Betaproteobacteria bacterium]